jgi:hypothetical protein
VIIQIGENRRIQRETSRARRVKKNSPRPFFIYRRGIVHDAGHLYLNACYRRRQASAPVDGGAVPLD